MANETNENELFETKIDDVKGELISFLFRKENANVDPTGRFQTLVALNSTDRTKAFPVDDSSNSKLKSIGYIIPESDFFVCCWAMSHAIPSLEAKYWKEDILYSDYKESKDKKFKIKTKDTEQTATGYRTVITSGFPKSGDDDDN